MDYKQLIRDLPDYPIKGVVFKDLTTLWKDGKAFKNSINDIVQRVKGLNVNKVVAMESRGFIMGSAVAYELGAGFVPVRKKKKLPWKVFSQDYELEYGKDFIEIHQDAVENGDRVLIVDDLLATGGTTEATIKLLNNFSGVEVVGAAYLVELTFLNGKSKVSVPIYSIIEY